MPPASSPSSAASLDSLFDSVDAPIVAADLRGIVQRMNDAAEQWLGRSRGRCIGQPLSQIEPGGSLATLAAKTLAQGMTLHEDVNVGGAQLSIVASPWWMADKLLGVVLLARAPASVAEDDQHADIAALAAGLAHEVRNPLAALRGATELLAGELSSGVVTPNVREYLDLILRETARVDGLVGRLLSVAKPVALTREPVASGDLLHDLALRAHALAKARGVGVSVDERYDPALPPVSADRDVLLEGLVNIVRNAVEAMPATGGRLVLQAGLDPQRHVRVAGRTVSLLRILVRDNGAGLGAARQRLFTPFYSTKSAGTGLGLVLARRAIESHGGMLTLHDNAPPEPGAEACVLLPLESPHGT